ncbi:MAG: winged helix-turn-helix transcriptional regulator, partial [Promethearchaeota archaeon]
MDWLDKALLMELYGNSRISFQDLATKFHLTFNAIKYRVKKLEEIGVIQEYTVELSLEMLGLEPLSIGITTDDTEDMKALIDEIGNHRLVRQAIRVGNKYYGASAYATGTKEFFELKQFLESLNGVTNVEIHPVVSIIPDAPPLSKGKSRGQKVTFTKNQLHVLWCLTEDVRMSVGEIAKRVNLTPRRVSKILQDLQEGGGVHFTARINMLALGDVALSLIIHYNEKET